MTSPVSRKWLLTVLCLAASLYGSEVRAQRVLGRVLERGGGGAVPGAMVRLTNAEGPIGRAWLTAEDGRFRLDAPVPGVYGLLVERIGFATTVHEGVELVENGLVSLDLVVEPEAITLEGLEVEAQGGRCEVTGDGGTTQLLWDEARKALEAATWTEDEVSLRFQVSVWDRQIDPRTSQILYEELADRETVGANSVQSLSPQELDEGGYVQARPGFVFWYAPDAAVLLSDEFRETHCFSVVEQDEEDERLLGLAFEPDDERDLPDVEGVIWLDAESGRLDRVSFRYTGLRTPGANRAEGEVRWAELTDGRWIVRDWFIRAPMNGSRVGTPGATRRGIQSAVHEVGNRVDRVEGERFAWTPDIRPGRVTGLVFDSISGGVLSGAEVRIAGRGWRTQSDLDGRFELEDIGPGQHRLTFSHPTLDSIGVQPGWSTVDVPSGGEIDVTVAVPRWETLLAWSCGNRGAGALVGIVRRQDGARVGGATVEARPAEDESGDPLTDVSDQFGGFLFCEPPSGIARLGASRGRARSESTDTRVSPTTFAQSDLLLPPPPVDAPTVPGALRPALVGTVLARTSREALSGVTVELLDEVGDPVGSTLSEPDGSFRIVLNDGQEQVYLRVARLGYEGAISEAIDLSDGTRRVEVLLPTDAIEIDPVLVVVDGLVPELERVGFYARATQSPGLFIRRDDIEAVAPARTSDLLERAPGVRTFTDAMSGDLSRRVVFTRHTLASGDRCYPALYVDGRSVRIGGTRDTPNAPAIEGIDPPEEDRVPALDELIPPHEIEAVEMYPTPGQVPRRFTGLGTRCGVIVVWTRSSRSN